MATVDLFQDIREDRARRRKVEDEAIQSIFTGLSKAFSIPALVEKKRKEGEETDRRRTLEDRKIQRASAVQLFNVVLKSEQSGVVAGPGILRSLVEGARGTGISR